MGKKEYNYNGELQWRITMENQYCLGHIKRKWAIGFIHISVQFTNLVFLIVCWGVLYFRDRLLSSWISLLDKSNTEYTQMLHWSCVWGAQAAVKKVEWWMAREHYGRAIACGWREPSLQVQHIAMLNITLHSHSRVTMTRRPINRWHGHFNEI